MILFGVVAVGASANDLLGDTASKFLNEQYNGITPGNEMKPNAVMDSDKIDAVPLEDAKAQGLYIRKDMTNKQIILQLIT